MLRKIIVGSRQSTLALTQTNQVIEQLRDICAANKLEYEFEVRKIVTKGDRILDVTLSKVGGKGLFVKEIEQEMMDGGIDFAVHSMKDMPSELPEGLMIGAIPKRIDPRDSLIANDGLTFQELPKGALIGTSSLRRVCQLKAARPDLRLEWIRGNIDTRLRKLREGEFDAIILAAAGLQRIGWEDRITQYLPVDLCLPAVGQGALGVECRENDNEVRQLLDLYNDPDTAKTVSAERSFLHQLNGGCQVPIGAYATLEEDGSVRLTGLVGSADGSRMLKETEIGQDAVQLGKNLANRLIDLGAESILLESRG